MTNRITFHFFYNFVMKIDVNYSFREPGLKLQSSFVKSKVMCGFTDYKACSTKFSVTTSK